MPTPPQSREAELRVLAAAFDSPDTAIPTAMGLGLTADDFHTVTHGWVWKAILDLYRTDGVIRESVVEQQLRASQNWARTLEHEVFGNLPETPGDEIGYWASIIIDKKLRRDKLDVGRAIGMSALNTQTDAYESIGDEQLSLDKLATRYVRMRNPVAENPAVDLRKSKDWFTSTGLGFVDRWLLLTSGELHFIAGDPSSGKSTCAIQMAAFNARQGTPVVLILAESDTMDVRMSLLLQTREVDGYFINNVRFNKAFRTEKNFKTVEELWDRHYGSLPISIYMVEQGVDEVVSIISSHTEPSLVMVDHAYAVVAQTERASGFKEHQQFINLFSKTRAACKRRNHVGVMFNQFKLEGRKADDRGPDAQYGGSGVQNIAGTMIHIWPESGEAYTESGFRMIRSAVLKIRVMLLVDKHGTTIDPRGKEDRFWLESRYRVIVDELPTGIPPSIKGV